MYSTNRSKIITLRALLLVFAVFYCCAAFSQQKHFTQHFTADNGLPQNSIKSIAADADGFLWLATEDGLTRFDGRSFKVFGKDKTGLKSNRLICILPGQRDSKNKSLLNSAYAWVASDEFSKIQNGGVVPGVDIIRRRERELTALRAIRKEIYLVNGLPERWPRTILPNHPTLITASDIGGNFFLCDQLTVTYYQQWKKQYQVENDAPERLNYFTLGGQLYYFDGKKSFVQISKNHRSTFYVKGDISKYKDFREQKSQVKIYWNNNSDQAFFYVAGQLFEIVQEDDGKLTTHQLISGFDLIAEEIDVIHFDREDRKIFLGSSTNGLFVLSIPQFETIRVSGSERPNIFYAQVPYDEYSVLTPTGIIAGKDGTTGKIIDRRLAEIEKLKNDDRRFIFKDRQGNIWAKSGYTLTRFNKNNQIIGSWKFKNGVKAVCQASNSEFWIGVYEVGVFVLDTNDSEAEPKFIGIAPPGQITCMSVKNSNEAWLGTITGLYSINIRSKRVSLVPGTSGLYIKNIQPFDKNRSWVTMLDRGLVLLNSDLRFTTFPLDKQGYLNSAHYTFNDGNGFLWIPTNRGLFQMQISDLLQYADQVKTEASENVNSLARGKPNLFYAYHSMDEGFNTNEFNGGCNSCGLKLSNGYVSLPSLDGLVWFKPSAISVDELKGRIFLDDILVDGKSMKTSGDTIELPMKPENVKLHFSTAYFGNRHNLKMSYALTEAGLPNDVRKWQEIDENNNGIIIPYSSLPSGTYIFTIRKQAGFGLNKFITKQLKIIVPAPWYEKGWVHFVLGLLFFAVVFAIWRLRFKNIELRNNLLENQVAMRTDELRQTLLSLESTRDALLRQFHLQSALLSSMAHDLRSPLSAAMLVTNEVGRLIDHQEYKRAILLNRQVEEAVGLIKHSVDELLAYVKVQVYDKEVKMEEVALAKLIDKNFQLYAKTARVNANTFKNTVPASITVFTNPQLLDVLIRNLTDNANKFTENGTISASWITSQNSYSLVIQDTGKGLPASIIEWLSETGSAPIPNNYHGLGLVIVKELAPVAKIRLNIQSDTNGTQVSLTFADGNKTSTTFT